MKTELYKDIQIKGGELLPKGLEVDVRFTKETSSVCIVNANDKEYTLRCKSVFEPPDMETLKEWNSDGGCESVLGNWTEPDGYDEYGAPSWIMVLGFI